MTHCDTLDHWRQYTLGCHYNPAGFAADAPASDAAAEWAVVARRTAATRGG